MFIPTHERDADSEAAFRTYAEYLRDKRDEFPPSALALATSDWYFDFSNHGCPHDGWLESLHLEETSGNDAPDARVLTLAIRLLGAYHDGYIKLEYPEVFSYRLQLESGACGHRDWRYDEFRINDRGHLVHEIEWVGAANVGTWVVEASGVIHRWVPFA